ncbi:MAG: phosphatase PAP2 family protein [Solirubrobacteraceae bacterium]
MAATSRAADHGVLWLALALAMASFGGVRGRRAASRGMLALAFASATVNGPIKLLVRRPRPSHRRRLSGFRMPHSYSFPSGHATSAFAFATAASCELPIVAPFVIPLASLVAYSRVYLGVHYPSDVVFGAAIGVASGLAVTSLPAKADHANAGRAKHT